MSDTEKKVKEARELASAMSKITSGIKDESARRMVMQRVAGIVDGARLAQSATVPQKSA